MKEITEKYKRIPVPLHLINPSNFIAAGKGAGKQYIYAHDRQEKTSSMQTLPPGVAERGFYEPDGMGFEKNIRERMAYWQKLKDKMAQAADRGTGAGAPDPK